MAARTLSTPVRISLLAIPEVYMSSLSGFYDTFGTAAKLSEGRVKLEVEVVASTGELKSRPSGMPIVAHRTLDEATDSDVVIVPTTVDNGAGWIDDSHPSAARWLANMYERGSTVCSACSGALLLAESGLLDGEDITTHWLLAPTFRARFPSVRVLFDHQLVASGEDGRIVTSGASSAWHDLALYLIARVGDGELAYETAKFFMYQWHADGQALYVDFEERLDHGDAAILRAQAWLADNVALSNPVEAMTERSGLATRTFKRRFRDATGHSPISYVQNLRIQHAKRMLARTQQSVEQVAWGVGYEDSSAFHRLFKRITRVTPGAYRRKMEVRAPYRAGVELTTPRADV